MWPIPIHWHKNQAMMITRASRSMKNLGRKPERRRRWGLGKCYFSVQQPAQSEVGWVWQLKKVSHAVWRLEEQVPTTSNHTHYHISLQAIETTWAKEVKKMDRKKIGWQRISIPNPSALSGLLKLLPQREWITAFSIWNWGVNKVTTRITGLRQPSVIVMFLFYPSIPALSIIVVQAALM